MIRQVSRLTGRRPRLHFFKSKEVSWDQGAISLKRVRWHSCMKWGWDRINSGERLAEWADYWVLSFKVGTWGCCWEWFPHRPSYERTQVWP